MSEGMSEERLAELEKQLPHQLGGNLSECLVEIRRQQKQIETWMNGCADAMAQTTAMRAALEYTRSCTRTTSQVNDRIYGALSGVAGKELLEWARAVHPFIEGRGPFPEPPEWLK